LLVTNYFKNSSASGGHRPPDPIPGLCPWTPLGDIHPPDPLWFCLPHPKPPSTAYVLYPVSERASHRALQSATNNDMVVPCSWLKFGERAFSIAAPRAWNSIPADLCTTLNTATFKKNLKTFLFHESYSTF